MNQRPYPSSSSSSGSLIEHLQHNYKLLKDPTSSTSHELAVPKRSSLKRHRTLEFLSAPRRDKNEESSRASPMDDYVSSPLQQHINKLLEITHTGMSDLALVPDNARSLPRSFQSTPIANRRKLFSKSLSDQTVMGKSKYRPCRWTSEYSSSTANDVEDEQAFASPPMHPSKLKISLAAMRQGPPSPPFLSPERSPKRNMQRDGKVSKSRSSSSLSSSVAAVVLASQGSNDRIPLLPSRSDVDLSDHFGALSIGSSATRRPNHEQLQRRSSDSVLARPERRDSSEDSTGSSLEEVPSLESL